MLMPVKSWRKRLIFTEGTSSSPRTFERVPDCPLHQMRVIGAGVICYSRDHGNGEVYVLLGKEKETPEWRTGSNRWSGFSGKVDPTERVALAAAREFLEESLCSVRLARGGDTKCKYESPEQVERALRRALPVEIIIPGKTETCKHITFLAYVDFVDYPRAFHECREDLLAMDAVFKQFHADKKTYLESISNILLPGSSLSSTLVVRDVRVLSDREVEVELWCREDRSKTYHVFTLTSAVMQDFQALNASWRAVARLVEENKASARIDHPALRIAKVNGAMYNAFIDKSYMEKSELRWWSVTELREIARNKELHKDVFRPYFLDFLDCLVTTIEREMQSSTPDVAVGARKCNGEPEDA